MTHKQRRLANGLSIMFVIGVFMVLANVSDAMAMTKEDAAAASIELGYNYCEASAPEGFVCKYRPFGWYVRHTTEVLKRRAGAFGFERAYSRLRYAYARPRAKYGVEMGCVTIVLQQTYGVFIKGNIAVRCENPKKPKLIGMVRLLGSYY